MKTYSERAEPRLWLIGRIRGLSTVTLWAVAAIGLASIAALNTGESRLSVIEANYTKTSLTIVDGQETTTDEVGRFRIAADGRYRVDYTVGGRDKTLIRNADGGTSTLDHGLREVTHGPSPFPVSSLPLDLPDVQATTLSLGTKTIGEVVLNGTQMTKVVNTAGGRVSQTLEIWDYRFDDSRLLPIVLEESYESGGTSEDQHIVDAFSVVVSDDLFDVPSGYTVK